MTDYKATPKQWAELRAKVEAIEAKYETMRLATLEWGKDVENLQRWSDQHLQRIMALEAAQQQPEPIDEKENDRRFHACMDLIKNATPEQIRAAAGLPEPNNITFHSPATEEIIRLDKEGFHYRGQFIADAGEAHRLMVEFHSKEYLQ